MPASAVPAGRALPVLWLDGLLAVCDETCREADRSLGLRLQLLAALRILGESPADRQQLVYHDIVRVADGICEDQGLGYQEVDLTGGSSDLSRGFQYDSVDALLDLLADFGAVTVRPGDGTPPPRPGQDTRPLPAVTPLGRWAAKALAAGLPGAVSPGAPPTEAITAFADAARETRDCVMRRWLGAREPAAAVRELLEAADPLPARLRSAAVEAARMTGEDGLPGWAAIARDAGTWPSSARHARAELHLWEMDAVGVVPSPDAADWQWLAVEAAAAALDEADRGADEALCLLWEAAGETDSIDGVLAGARASGHREAARVLEAVTALAASATPLTVRQGIQLKVTLRDSSPPTWRSVQLPLAFTLGDLHRVIQVLSAGMAITCTPSPSAAPATPIPSSTWRTPGTRRKCGSATPSRRAPASRSGTTTTSGRPGSTRSPARSCSRSAVSRDAAVYPHGRQRPAHRADQL